MHPLVSFCPVTFESFNPRNLLADSRLVQLKQHILKPGNLKQGKVNLSKPKEAKRAN